MLLGKKQAVVHIAEKILVFQPLNFGGITLKCEILGGRNPPLDLSSLLPLFISDVIILR
jgi:hypothetical protein